MGIGASRRVARLLALVLLLGLGPARSWALDPALDATQYSHTQWKIRDGFSKTRISAMAQSADGYLWMGTPFGLLRFDGVRSVPWEPPNGATLPDRRIRALLAARDGTLWIGTDRGVASWRDGAFVTYAGMDGKFVTGIVEDRDGKIWIGAVSIPGNGWLCTIQQGRTECTDEGGMFKGPSVALYLDTRGRLWVASGRTAWQWTPGRPVPHAMPEPLKISRNPISEAPSGEILVLTTQGIRKLGDRGFEPFTLPTAGISAEGTILMHDRDGALWIGTLNDGLLHVHQGRVDRFGPSNGLSGDFVNTLFEDREGNFWAATLEGIDRFRPMAATTFSRAQGLAVPVHSVVAGADAGVWINGTSGLYRGSIDGISPVVSWRSAGVDSGAGRSLFMDRKGRLWAGADAEFGYLEGKRFVAVPGVPRGLIDAISEDERGNLWLAHRDKGIFRMSPDFRLQPVAWTNPNRTGRGLFWRMAADPVNGGLWIGLARGIVHYVDGEVRSTIDLGTTLPRPRVNDLRVAADGTLWVASDGAVVRINDGRMAVLDKVAGLPCEDIDSTADDDEGALWLFTPCGISRIAASDVASWVAAIEQGHAPRQIRAMILDGSEGTRYSATPRAFGPHVAKARDGKLWFATIDGATVIDPTRVPRSQSVPPVHIEQIVADRKAHDSSAPVRLPPLARDLQIDYTAPTLTAPEKAVFRYMLEGYDRDWREVGTRRQAFYTDLGPGDYRFRVTASNGGAWNEKIAVLDFSIAPAYWQTWWFRTLCMFAAAALLWALYRLRVRQLRQQFNATLDARVAERTRIARELHDTLLQTFHGVLLRFHTAHELLPDRPGDAKRILASSLDRAAGAITEGRDAVQGLRATESNDLAGAIRMLGEEIAAGMGGGQDLRVEVRGAPRSLHPVLRDEIFRIASEALRNAFSHSDARRIEVELRYEERHLLLRVRDDGKGIDPAIMSRGREGHYGMSGMRERAALLGGKLAVSSAVGGGTEVELSVPSSRAYASP